MTDEEAVRILTIGNGVWISVGWNDAGLNLTGNELSPNDERVGIPREIQVRAMLRERTLQGMVDVALHPARASSYNNVLVDAGGGVANVEGSATAAEVTGADAAGHLVHTNHYVCGSMLGYEGDPEYAEHSAIRYRRAAALLAGAPSGTVTMDMLHGFLQDHEHAPDALCRHEFPGRTTVTAFWCVADVTGGVVLPGSHPVMSFGVSDIPTHSPIEIGLLPNFLGSSRLTSSQAQIKDAARWNCWLVKSRNVYRMSTRHPRPSGWQRREMKTTNAVRPR